MGQRTKINEAQRSLSLWTPLKGKQQQRDKLLNPVELVAFQIKNYLDEYFSPKSLKSKRMKYNRLAQKNKLLGLCRLQHKEKHPTGKTWKKTHGFFPPKKKHGKKNQARRLTPKRWLLSSTPTNRPDTGTEHHPMEVPGFTVGGLFFLVHVFCFFVFFFFVILVFFFVLVLVCFMFCLWFSSFRKVCSIFECVGATGGCVSEALNQKSWCYDRPWLSTLFFLFLVNRYREHKRVFFGWDCCVVPTLDCKTIHWTYVRASRTPWNSRHPAAPTE